MKLIIFTAQLSTIGGVERTLIDKANYMAAEGHEVLFVTIDHGSAPYFYDIDSRVRHIDLGLSYSRRFMYPDYKRLMYCLRTKIHLRSKLKKELCSFKPDLVIIATPNTEDYLYDVQSISKQYGAKVIVESHLASAYHFVTDSFIEKLMRFFFNPMRAIRNADLLVTLTDGDMKCWKSKGVPNVVVLPNPLTFSIVDNTCHPKEAGRIICVSRLEKQKRIDRLIDAFALLSDKYPSWNVDVFGEGSLYEALNDYISRKNLVGRIILHSPTCSIVDEYLKSQFLVLSSDYEGFGLIIIEAMACGIPVVSTDCPFGPADIVEDGVTGFLCKLDVNDLAQKMEWMILHENERKEMGLKARQVSIRYEKETILKKWETTYLSVL